MSSSLFFALAAWRLGCTACGAFIIRRLGFWAALLALCSDFSSTRSMDLVRAARLAIERRMSIADFDGVLDMIAGGGQPSYTGKLVSPRNALGVAPVWSCVNILADDWATLPIVPYRWLKAGLDREEARDHYLWPIWQGEANPRMSSFHFKHVMETWRQLWGNAYAEIETNGRGQVLALWPWRPDRVKVWLDNPNDVRSRIFYTYVPTDRSKKPITLPQEQMLHVRHISLDGIMGLSPIEVHRQTVGISMAMTEHQGRFYSNGAVIKGVLQHPGKLSEKAKESLKASIDEYRGLANSHRIAIFEEGLQYKEIGMPLRDAQYVESSNMNALDQCRVYKVPAHRAGYLERATNNNIEQLGMEYVQYTLGPNAANWCSEIHFSMLSTRELADIFVEPDFTHLLMGDHAARAAYYTALANAGVLSPDEMRGKEGYNPLPGGVGKLPRVPMNTMPIGSSAPAPAGQGAKKANGLEAVQ